MKIIYLLQLYYPTPCSPLYLTLCAPYFGAARFEGGGIGGGSLGDGSLQELQDRKGSEEE